MSERSYVALLIHKVCQIYTAPQIALYLVKSLFFNSNNFLIQIPILVRNVVCELLI